MTFEYCEGWRNRSGPVPEGIICPPRLKYPSPPNQVEVLFVGWNPPGEKHFWNSREDNLYRDLSWVFRKLGWLSTPDLWQVFREKKFYLVHAVKCCTEAQFRWNVPNLIETCSKALLEKELAELKPKIVCALGEVPHLALRVIFPSLPYPLVNGYGKGWCDVVNGMKVIVTCFPRSRWNHSEKKLNRECTVLALEKWIGRSAEAE